MELKEIGFAYSPNKGDGAGSSPMPTEAEKAAEMGKALEASKYADMLSNVEILASQVETPILIHAADELISRYEDEDFHNEGYKNDYAFMHIIDTMLERERNLKLTKEDLNALGIIKNYQSEKDQAIFEVRGYSYKKKMEEIVVLSEVIKKPSGEEDKVFKISQIEADVVGSDKQRITLSSKINLLRGEMIARQDLTKMYGTIVRNTENLEGIVQELYYRQSMTPKAMEILFNAEARVNTLKKTEGGAKYESGKERGQARDAAVRCLEIVGCAEDYQKLKDKLQRPGIKFLFNVTDAEIDLLFVPANQRGGLTVNPVLAEWIGDPSTWTDVNGSLRQKKVFTNEIRGKLTKEGNIFVESSQDKIDSIKNNIEDFISAKGGKGRSPLKSELLKREAKAVVNSAWGWFRVTGKATTYGYTFYEKNGQKLPFSDMGGVTSCDRIKVMYPEIFRAIYKRNKTETRDWGPDGSFGKYERFGVDYDKGLSLETEYGKRTVDEIRWGYRAEGNLPEELPKRYGDLDYSQMNVKIFNKSALGMYIAGRPEIGIFQYIMKTNWEHIKVFQNKDFWTQFAKHMGISLSSEVALDGKLRGSDDRQRESAVKEYKKRVFLAFWDGLRSLPQWREWLVEDKSRLDRNGAHQAHWIDRIKYYIGNTNILSKDEIIKLTFEPFSKDVDA